MARKKEGNSAVAVDLGGLGIFSPSIYKKWIIPVVYSVINSYEAARDSI